MLISQQCRLTGLMLDAAEPEPRNPSSPVQLNRLHGRKSSGERWNDQLTQRSGMMLYTISKSLMDI